jgi:hypothetical protein
MNFETTRSYYSGATPGADSNTYVMFSTVTLGVSQWFQAAGIRHARIDIKHDQSFTLNAYKSSDKGVTWNQVSTEAIAVISGFTSSRVWNVETFADFKIEVVNGGSAQGTWAVDVVFIERRADTSDDSVLKLLPFSFIEADNFTVDGVSGKVASFVDKVYPGTGVRAVVANHAFVQATSANQVVVPAQDSRFASRRSAIFTGAEYYDSQASASDWLFLHAGTGMTMLAVRSPTSMAAGAVILATRNGGSAGVSMGRTTTQFTINIQNATTVIGTNQGGTPAVDKPDVQSLTYLENVSPEFVHRRGNTTLGSGNTTGAPITTVSTAGTLRLGATRTPSSQEKARWVMAVVFARVITQNELAVIHTYIREKYGVQP